MMKDEFDALIECATHKKTTEEQWNVIHQVYQFYPGVKDVGGKQQVANLFLQFGMAIFQDMLPRAERVATLEHRRQQHMVEINNIDNELHELRG